MIGMAMVYKVEGYAQTRDALMWATAYAPTFKYGLTFEQVIEGLEHGYQSVRAQLKDSERIDQWERSRRKLHQAYELFQKGDARQGSLTLQQAQELFTTLRRIQGKTVSRQKLGETENGANEVDEE